METQSQAPKQRKIKACTTQQMQQNRNKAKGILSCASPHPRRFAVTLHTPRAWLPHTRTIPKDPDGGSPRGRHPKQEDYTRRYPRPGALGSHALASHDELSTRRRPRCTSCVTRFKCFPGQRHWPLILIAFFVHMCFDDRASF